MYEAKNFENLLGLPGLSDNLLKNHFSLYQGYVSSVNKLSDLLDGLLRGEKFTTPEYAELKRRFGWEWNGMRLHEYYFENLAKDSLAIDEESSLYKKIVEDFGSFENWEKDFRGIAAIRGIGWVILCYDKISDKLLNIWINEHDAGHLSGAEPLLVMDVFEHAYMLDYGIKKADYIKVFFNIINWEAVLERYNKAISN